MNVFLKYFYTYICYLYFFNRRSTNNSDCLNTLAILPTVPAACTASLCEHPAVPAVVDTLPDIPISVPAVCAAPPCKHPAAPAVIDSLPITYSAFRSSFAVTSGPSCEDLALLSNSRKRKRTEKDTTSEHCVKRIYSAVSSSLSVTAEPTREVLEMVSTSRKRKRPEMDATSKRPAKRFQKDFTTEGGATTSHQRSISQTERKAFYQLTSKLLFFFYYQTAHLWVYLKDM